jgi:hypothetical protein
MILASKRGRSRGQGHNARWRRSAKRMVKRASPERAVTARLRREPTFRADLETAGFDPGCVNRLDPKRTRDRESQTPFLKPGLTSGGYISLAAQNDPRRANSGPAIVTVSYRQVLRLPQVSELLACACLARLAAGSKSPIRDASAQGNPSELDHEFTTRNLQPMSATSTAPPTSLSSNDRT